MRSDKIRFWKL